MGRCIKCGGPTPGNLEGQICPVCSQRERLKADSAAKNNSSSGSSGYQTSGNSWQTNARLYKSGSGIRVLIIIAIVVAGAFLGIRYLSFNSTESKLADSFEITEPMKGDGSDFVDELLNRDDSFARWSMKITEYPTDYWKTIFSFSPKSAYIRGYMQDDETIWRYDFEDADVGTGLNSIYYIATVNDELCIADYNDEVLYPEGSAFYEEHYDALLALQYDSIMPKLTEGLTGGEYGSEKHDKKVVLIGDNVRASVYDDDYHKTRILDERGDARIQYELNYYEKGADDLPDFSSYKIKK